MPSACCRPAEYSCDQPRSCRWAAGAGRWRWPSAVATVLWYGPSHVPLVWVYLVRFLPFAAAFLWPLVRLMPRELFEAGRLDGAGPGQELLRIVVPDLAPAGLRAALMVTVLAL